MIASIVRLLAFAAMVLAMGTTAFILPQTSGPIVARGKGALFTVHPSLALSGAIASSDGGGSGPAVLDKPETIEKSRVEDSVKEKEKHGSEGWEVRLFNDPMNKREFVARCLTEICGMSDGQSFQVMMQAHQSGVAVIGRYNFELAELYHNSLRDNGLLVDMRPVDDDA